MSSKEITHLVERMEAIEDRLGITISGIYASVKDEPYNGEYIVEINGEVYSQSGSGLSESISVQFVCQNEKGQVVGKTDDYIGDDEFTGYHVFSESVFCKAYPTRIKIFPKIA